MKRLLNRMPNIWTGNEYTQGFDCEPITLKKDVNMFKLMEIEEYIYEDVLERSYKTHYGRLQPCGYQKENERIS